MTEEEFLEKYGKVKVKFNRYYKYTFTYMGVTDDNLTVLVDTGGDHNDIYKKEVLADTVHVVEDLYPYAGTVYDKDKKEVASFYSY